MVKYNKNKDARILIFNIFFKLKTNITHKFMTFYLILKNWKYVKQQVSTQNKQKWIVHSKNIIINKFMTYFYAEKCFVSISYASHTFSNERPTFLIVYPPPHGLWCHLARWTPACITSNNVLYVCAVPCLRFCAKLCEWERCTNITISLTLMVLRKNATNSGYMERHP